MNSPVPQLMEAVVEVYTTGARAESFPGADYGFPCASAHGRSRGRYTTGARAESHAIADCGYPCATDHGCSWGSCAYYTTGARAKSCARADSGVPCASDRSGERAEMYAGAGFSIPSASDHGGSRGSFSPTPQVRVQSRKQEQIMDLPVPQFMAASKPYTGKVFTVEMPHQHVHQAYPGDYVVFNIKGLDKLNLPRSGDVMVPALPMEIPVPQIAEEIVERPVARERIIERFGPSISWDSLEASLRHGLLRRLRQRAFEMDVEEEEEEEEDEEEGEILASS